MLLIAVLVGGPSRFHGFNSDKVFLRLISRLPPRVQAWTSCGPAQFNMMAPPSIDFGMYTNLHVLSRIWNLWIKSINGNKYLAASVSAACLLCCWICDEAIGGWVEQRWGFWRCGLEGKQLAALKLNVMEKRGVACAAYLIFFFVPWRGTGAPIHKVNCFAPLGARAWCWGQEQTVDSGIRTDCAMKLLVVLYTNWSNLAGFALGQMCPRQLAEVTGQDLYAQARVPVLYDVLLRVGLHVLHFLYTVWKLQAPMSHVFGNKLDSCCVKGNRYRCVLLFSYLPQDSPWVYSVLAPALSVNWPRPFAAAMSLRRCDIEDMMNVEARPANPACGKVVLPVPALDRSGFHAVCRFSPRVSCNASRCHLWILRGSCQVFLPTPPQVVTSLRPMWHGCLKALIKLV